MRLDDDFQSYFLKNVLVLVLLGKMFLVTEFLLLN